MVVNPRCDIWEYFDNIVEEGVAVCKLCKQRLKNERSFSLRKHIENLHNPKTDIWKYFLNHVEEGVAECKTCHKRVRNNRHFNLSSHLSKHDIIIADENEDSSATPGCSNGAVRPKQSKEGLYILMKERVLVNAVVGLMVDEGVVPAVFSSENMQALLNPMCDAISRQNQKKFTIDEQQSEQAIQSVASFIRDDFANDIHWRLLSLKISSNVPNIFGVSVQFVNESQLETRVLGEIHLEDEQQLTSKCILAVLREFNIDVQQIVTAYLDKPMVKFSHSVANSDYLAQIKEFEKYPDIFVGDIKLTRYIGTIAHLCVLDVLKNPNILKLFFECRNLTKFINTNPTIFKEIFKQNNIDMPVLDSPWKCGSTYDMISDLGKARCILDDLKYDTPESVDDHFNFNANLKNFIDAFSKSLRFLQNCLQKFYNTEMIYSDFYGQWLKCKLLTEKLYAAYSKEDTILALICSQLLKSFEARSEELLNQDHFKACLYLDPRFQRTLNTPEKMFALEYLNQLWERAKLYNKELVDPVDEPLVENCPTSSQKMDNDADSEDVLNEFLSKFNQEASPAGICKKLNELRLPFQRVETNVLLYWKELKSTEPEIYTLAAICFAIPATRNYNKAINLNEQQASIGTEKLSPLLKQGMNFIRLNQHLLQKALEDLDLFREDSSSEIEISERQFT